MKTKCCICNKEIYLTEEKKKEYNMRHDYCFPCLEEANKKWRELGTEFNENDLSKIKDKCICCDGNIKTKNIRYYYLMFGNFCRNCLNNVNNRIAEEIPRVKKLGYYKDLLKKKGLYEKYKNSWKETLIITNYE